jgi:ATP synthase protein I
MPPELPPEKESDSQDFDRNNSDRQLNNTGDQPAENQTDNQKKASTSRSDKPGITASKYSAAEFGKRAKTIGSLGMIPILLAAGPIIGALGGRWLDKQFETDPWLTILFVILGFVAAVREMLRLLKQSERDEEREKKSQERP